MPFKPLFASGFQHYIGPQTSYMAELRIKGQGNKFNHSIKINLKVTYIKVIGTREGELVEILM